MLRKFCAALILASVASAAGAQELGASIDSEEKWFGDTGSSAIELRLTRGTAQVERILFLNQSDKAIDIVDMNMTRIRTIKPRQSVDVTESVEEERHVAISIGGGHLIYLELEPGMSVIAANLEEDPS